MDCRSPFDTASVGVRVKVLGVDYLRLHPADGGELYVTREGWPFVESLMPSAWFPGGRMSPDAERLDGATGTVYRIRGTPRPGRPVDIVVKFTRFAQHVPLHSGTTFPEHVWLQLMTTARFHSPFEEIAALQRLRRSNQGRSRMLRTKRAFAIYSPPSRYALWQTGRSQSEFDVCRQRLASDQSGAESPVEMDIERDYIVLFGWVHGLDAEQVYLRNGINQRELHGLTVRVASELHDRGFHVLDNKPKHFVLRTRRRNGELMRRNGELVYALIDFELLVDDIPPDLREKLLQAMQRAAAG
jgi:hypothetical protein